jgi:hypothetical protein
MGVDRGRQVIWKLIKIYLRTYGLEQLMITGVVLFGMLLLALLVKCL